MGLALVARDVGVKYDLRLTQRRTLKQTLTDTVLRIRADYDKDPTFWALEGVTFVAEQGEVVGIVGRNGAGKSTLLLTIAGIMRPDTGLIRTFGRPSTLLTIGAGFEPDLTGRENVYLNGALLGLTRRYVDRRLDDIVEFSGLDRLIDLPLRKYSTGMRARLGFSIAVHTEPDILLIDEVLSVGDEGFRNRSREKLEDLMETAHAIVVVSHDMSFVRRVCTKALWLEEGRVAAWGPSEEVVDRYLASTRDASGPVRLI